MNLSNERNISAKTGKVQRNGCWYFRTGRFFSHYYLNEIWYRYMLYDLINIFVVGDY